MAQCFFELLHVGTQAKTASPSPSSNVQARRRALPELIAREAIGADTPWCITRKTGVESAELPVVTHSAHDQENVIHHARSGCYAPIGV